MQILSAGVISFGMAGPDTAHLAKILMNAPAGNLLCYGKSCNSCLLSVAHVAS